MPCLARGRKGGIRAIANCGRRPTGFPLTRLTSMVPSLRTPCPQNARERLPFFGCKATLLVVDLPHFRKPPFHSSNFHSARHRNASLDKEETKSKRFKN